VIARDEMNGGDPCQVAEEPLGGLELAVPGPLSHIAGHNDHPRHQSAEGTLQGRELGNIGASPIVDVANVGDEEVAHQMIRTR
jgi:hypothetical protein